MAQMKALVYEGPHSMPLRDVPVPGIQPDQALVRVAYSGICGSELSGFEGKNELRKPPLIMGHEFSGTVEQVGDEAARAFGIRIGQLVTVNPLVSCGRCNHCLSGQQQVCSNRKLHSASLPGSNAQFIAVRADSVYPLPDNLPLSTAALTEPAACAVHCAAVAAPRPHETGLVVGAGPIGILIIQALKYSGLEAVYCAELNPERLAMAEASGAVPVDLGRDDFRQVVDIAVDAVGSGATRRACVAATRSGGRVIWVGLHEPATELPINDLIRREITAYGSFAYTPLDFARALKALGEGRLGLDERWMRVEPLANGSACFEELISGSAASKILLRPE